MTGTTKFVAGAAAVAVTADLTRRGAVAAAVAVGSILLVAYAATRLRAASAVIAEARTLDVGTAAPAAAVAIPAQRDVTVWLTAPSLHDGLAVAR